MAPASNTEVIERKPGVRELAAQATRESILRAAIKIFAKHGFAGGRVEQISKAAKSYDRMIYYYFGSKEALYIAALEEIYRRFNEPNRNCSSINRRRRRPCRGGPLHVDLLPEAPEFITLLNTETFTAASTSRIPPGARILVAGSRHARARVAAGRGAGVVSCRPVGARSLLTIAALLFLIPVHRSRCRPSSRRPRSAARWRSGRRA